MRCCYGHKKNPGYCDKDCNCDLLECTTFDDYCKGKRVFIVGRDGGVCMRDDKDIKHDDIVVIDSGHRYPYITINGKPMYSATRIEIDDITSDVAAEVTITFHGANVKFKEKDKEIKMIGHFKELAMGIIPPPEE